MQTSMPGATVTPDGVRYCVWSPLQALVTVEIHRKRDGSVHTLELIRAEQDRHMVTDPEGQAGDTYGFRLNGGNLLPDPVSRAQAESVHGLSVVVDPTTYQWHDADWERPPFRDIVIYELHVGTFSPEGTFRGAIHRLPHLKELGITAIEIMPLADFPGAHNWGYDGVLLYAPARCYGPPDHLRELVDAAHAADIAVILDVVYNHFGPDGNYVASFSPSYFHSKHHTPWGNGLNFDAEGCAPVRDFFRNNPIYWMEEFHIDGFRFDAAHEIHDDSTPHILAEMSQAIHQRGGYTVAEDPRNEVKLITEYKDGGVGLDGVWADDFHHAARVAETHEQHSYFEDFSGSVDDLLTVLRDGWLYSGQTSKVMGVPRGTSAGLLPPQRFIHCISNHDQVGNRAMGERLNHLISPEAYRVLSALLCLSPYTPMLFMGQEWAASTPFLFFTEHNLELGKLITEGRRKEFANFPGFADPALRETIPDPQDVHTFERSKLQWGEIPHDGHAKTLLLYRTCLKLRRENTAFRPIDRRGWRAEKMFTDAGGIFLGDYLIAFDVNGGSRGPLPVNRRWEVILSTEEKRFGGSGALAWNGGTEGVYFPVPELLLLKAH